MQPEVLGQALEVILPLVQGGNRRVLVGIAGPPGAGKSSLAEAVVVAAETRAREDRAREDRAREDRAPEIRATEDRATEDRARADRAPEIRATEDHVREDPAAETRARDPRAVESRTAGGVADDEEERFAVCVPMDGFHLSNRELDRLGLSNRKGAPETFDAAGFVHLLERIARREELVYAPAYSRVLHESVGGVIPVHASARLVVLEGNYLLLRRPPWDRVRRLLDLVVYVDAPDGVRVAGLIRRQRARGLDEHQARDWVERSDEANARLVAATRDDADVVLTRGA